MSSEAFFEGQTMQCPKEKERKDNK